MKYSTAEGTIHFYMFKMYTVHLEILSYKNTVCTPHLPVRYYASLQREHAFNKLLPHKGTAHVKQPIYYLQFVMQILHKAFFFKKRI